MVALIMLAAGWTCFDDPEVAIPLYHKYRDDCSVFPIPLPSWLQGKPDATLDLSLGQPDCPVSLCYGLESSRCFLFLRAGEIGGVCEWYLGNGVLVEVGIGFGSFDPLCQVRCTWYPITGQTISLGYGLGTHRFTWKTSLAPGPDSSFLALLRRLLDHI